MRALSLLLACLLCASCAHKGALITPREIAEKQRKDEAAAAKKAAKEQKKNAATPAPATTPQESQEVTVP
jgi:hypothetical protein